MNKKILLSICVVSIVWLSACSKPDNSKAHPIVAAYSVSWNEKDVQKMTALMHPDIQWLSVTDNTISVEVSGKTELVAEMTEWFDSPNLPAGSLRDWSLNGNYVAVTETAAWTDKAGTAQSQSSLTVYELEDNLIRRVYYYPSVKN